MSGHGGRFFKIKFISVTLVNKFQVYNSIMRCLCGTVCAHRPKSSLPLSLSLVFDPLYPAHPPPAHHPFINSMSQVSNV